MKHDQRIRLLLTGITLLIVGFGCDNPDSNDNSTSGYPVTFNSPSPPNGAVLDTWSVDLSWQWSGDVSAPFNERVILYNGYSNTVINEFDSTGGSVQLSEIPSNKYRWQVIGTADSETLGVSRMWEFQTTISKPEQTQISLITPQNGDTVQSKNVILKWQLNPDIEPSPDLYYNVYFGGVGQQMHMMANYVRANELELQVDSLDQWYHWSVIGMEADEPVYSSPEATFFVTTYTGEPFGWYYRLQHDFHYEYIQSFSLESLDDQELFARVYFEYGVASSHGGMSSDIFSVQIDDHIVAITKRIDYFNGRIFSPNQDGFVSMVYTAARVLINPIENFYRQLDQRIRVSELTMDGSSNWSNTFVDTLQDVEVVDAFDDTLTLHLAGWSTFWGLTRNTDGSLVIAGSLRPRDSQETYLLAYSLDENGNELWRKTYEMQHNWVGKYIYPALGGYKILAEERTSDGSVLQLWFIKLSEAGEWVDSTPLALQVKCNDLVKFDDDGFGFWERIPPYGYRLVRIDADGEMLWSYDFNPDWYNDPKLVATQEGNLVTLTGNRLESYSVNGSLNWSRKYINPQCVCRAEGGGFYLIVQDWEQSDRNYDYVLVYADEFGRNSRYMYQQ